MVIILDDIEYASGGGKSKENQATAGQQNAAPRILLRKMLLPFLRQALKHPEILQGMKHLAADHSLMRIDWSNN